MIPAADLAFDGGTVVTAEGRRHASVYVRDGRISHIGEGALPAAERIDASSLLVLPGFVDTHVHLMEPADPQREDWPSGTAAAAAAGVTTVIEHTHQAPMLTVDDFSRKHDFAAQRAVVDFALAAHAFPESLDEVGSLTQHGVAFIKAFTCTTHGVPGLDEAALFDLFRRVAASGAVCLVHCEDEQLLSEAGDRLRKEGRSDGGVVPAWRTREAETTAVRRVAQLAQVTGAATVVAHASHPSVLRTVAAARAAATKIWVETCPQYLTLHEDEVLEAGALRKFTPPARARGDADLAEMWGSLQDNAPAPVHLISSDHAPSTVAQKKAADIWDAPFGLPGLDTTSVVLIDAACSGRISFERLVALYSTMPATIYGLAPKKGALEPGADADVVLVDPQATWVLANQHIRSRAGWTPFAGMRVHGRIAATWIRGVRVYEDGEVLAAPGNGRLVRRHLP